MDLLPSVYLWLRVAQTAPLFIASVRTRADVRHRYLSRGFLGQTVLDQPVV